MNHGPKALKWRRESQNFEKMQTKLTFGLYGLIFVDTNLYGDHNRAELGYDNKNGEI